MDQRIALLEDLLGAARNATRAGQSHLMTKTVALLRQEALRAQARFSSPMRALVDSSLRALTKEASRVAPDLAEFERHARALIDALRVASR